MKATNGAARPPRLYIEHTGPRSWFPVITFQVVDDEEDIFEVTWDCASQINLQTEGRTYFGLSNSALKSFDRILKDCREIKSAWVYTCVDPDATRFIRRIRHYLKSRWGRPPTVEVVDQHGNCVTVEDYTVRHHPTNGNKED